MNAAEVLKTAEVPNIPAAGMANAMLQATKPRAILFPLIKEVQEIEDHTKAAEMVNSGDWVIIGAAFRDGKLSWIVVRV